ncbi:AMP-binding enzyme [Kibdelosporangium philippinense]
MATNAAFDDGWFRSGDLAILDDEGYLYVVDRVKDMYISGGENVYPAEVEGVIFGHPAVAEVAVIGVPDPKWGEVGKAFVVCRPDTELTITDLRGFLAGRLAKYKIPAYLELVDGMPRTASGKVQKAKLR